MPKRSRKGPNPPVNASVGVWCWPSEEKGAERLWWHHGGFFFFTLVAGPRRSLSLKLGDTRVYEPQIRARLGTTANFCEVVVGTMEAAHGSRVRSSGFRLGWGLLQSTGHYPEPLTLNP